MGNKRDLVFIGTKGEYFKYIAKHLIKYFEDEEIEDFQINDFEKATLIKKGNKKEFIEDMNLTKDYIKTLMFFVSAISPKRLNNMDSQVSLMLPVNKFRFTGRIGNTIGSGIKISIRLNDNQLYHDYHDFGLKQLEFNFLIKHISQNGLSAFVIGGTGSGKTTFNNLLIKHISENELMNVIGDIHDYIFFGNQKVSEVFAKKDSDYGISFDLAMRSNPDRILVPELSVGNVGLILRAMNSGHKGFMLTMHSGNSVMGVAEAFAQNLKMNGVEADVLSIDKAIKANVDFLIYLSKHDGKRQIEKVEINNKQVQEEAEELEIFGFKKKKILKTGKKESKAKKSKYADIKIAKLIDDLSGGLNKTLIAKKHGLSRGTIIKLAKKIKNS